MVEGPVLARRMTTLASQQLHGTQCIYTAMCFTNCCVHPKVLNVYVKVLRKLTSVAVLFVEKFEFYQQSYSQRTLQSVSAHPNNLNNERSEVKESSILT
jgi:hypothetical protein